VIDKYQVKNGDFLGEMDKTKNPACFMGSRIFIGMLMCGCHGEPVEP
jgi:hypothetical protein